MNKKWLMAPTKNQIYWAVLTACLLAFAVGAEWRTQHIISLHNSLSSAVSGHDYYSASSYAHKILQEDPKHPSEYRRSEAHFLILANKPTLALPEYEALVQSGQATVYDYAAYARGLQSQGRKKDAKLVLSKAQVLFNGKP